MKNRRIKDVLNSYSLNRLFWSDSVYSSDSVHNDHTMIPNEPVLACIGSVCEKVLGLNHEKKASMIQA